MAKKKVKDADGNPPQRDLGWGPYPGEVVWEPETKKGLVSAVSEPPAAVPYVKCAASHKPLVVTASGLTIHGGSCLNPYVPDADIYIGFDMGMKMTKRRFPWEPGEEILFPISDMQAPKDAAEFKVLVAWTMASIEAGKKVHVGCIGGHGRTGLFLAALVRIGLGIEDAIVHVRQHYCEKAVESASQVDWLHRHFGIKKVVGAKAFTPYHGGNSHHQQNNFGSGKTKAPPLKMFAPTIPKNDYEVTPMKDSVESIWG